MDNNESFSSLWHAANLHSFGLSKSIGLADEAFAFHSAAHPYVHTHQGNFPRLFAYLIYVLGAKSIEAQVVVTTFSVGLVAMLLAYRFLATLVTPLFGFLACMVLMTDYMLVVQWQVVTYRVWYEFFIFSSALCVHACANRSRWWTWCTFLNFAGLFYFEFIFVAFVSLGTALYAIFTLRDVRRIAHFFFWIGAGGALALSVLLLQLTLYLGWEDLKRDAYLTFVARNQYLNDPALLQQMKEFFSSRNIVFWFNLEEGGRYRTPGYFIASLTRHELQLHTPLLTSIAGIVVGGLLAASLVPVVARFPWAGTHYIAIAILLAGAHLAHKAVRGESGTLQLIPTWAIAGVLVLWATAWLSASYAPRALMRYPRVKALFADPRRIRAGAAAALLILALPSVLSHVSATHYDPLATTGQLVQYSPPFVVYIVVYVLLLLWMLWSGLFGHSPRETLRRFSRLHAALPYPSLAIAVLAICSVMLLGDRPFGIYSHDGSRSTLWGAAVTAVLAFICALWLRRHGFGGLTREPIGGTQDGRRATMAFSMFVLVAAAGLFISWVLYDQSQAPLWSAIMEWSAPAFVKHVLVYLAVLLGAYMAASKPEAFLREGEWAGLKALGVFLACAFASYCVIYLLSPGYIFSGYRVRLAPFSVFHTNMLLAVAAFLIVALARRNAIKPQGGTLGNSLGGLRYGAVSLLVLVTWYWATMQVRYYQLMPADNFAFLKRLEAAPYKGKSFIVSNYAAPIAAATGQWAYLHSALSNNRLAQEERRYVVEMDPTYLWFADRDSNPDYHRPDYFICATPPMMWSLNEMVRGHMGLRKHPYGCSENVLVRIAAGQFKAPISPRVKLVEFDEEGPARVGFQRWAIVQLLWEGTD